VGWLALSGVRHYKKSLVPTLIEMKSREKRAGKIVMQRSAVIEWDMNREMNALSRRFKLQSKAPLVDAFITESYVVTETENRKKVGLEEATHLKSNKQLATEGREKLRGVLDKQLRSCYPLLPQQGTDSLVNYLSSSEVLVNIATEMGFNPLVMHSEKDPEPNPQMLEDALLAVFALVENCEHFSTNYILGHLMGKDVFDIWNPKDARHILNSLLKQKRLPEFEPRMVFETGRNTIEPVFYVAVYSDKRMLGKGAGCTQALAIEAAVRDSLRRIFRVTRADRSPFERMALEQISQQAQSIQ